MMVISRTPVRISLFGGGTDFPCCWQRLKGAVLGSTIDKYAYVSVMNTKSKFFDYKIRISYSKTELVNHLDEIKHPSVRECLKFMGIESNLDIHIFSDLPMRTGLGSSSSFTVSFLNALYALNGARISKQNLAKQACYIEQHMICENVGSQDQFHAAFGGFNRIDFDVSAVHVKPIVASVEKIAFLERHLMLFYTGLTRHASKVLEEQVQKTMRKENDQFLQKIAQTVDEAENIISYENNQNMVEQLGRLLHRGWNLKKQLSSKISNSWIDQLYEQALHAGAYGGKLCGAGSGGFLALLVSPVFQEQVKKALPNLLPVDLRFENTGSSIIYMKN